MQVQNQKRTLFVGGLDNSVNEKLLFGAFVPFGEVVSVNIAVKAGNKERKGYGFVEFELPEDAKSALENMDNAELCGRVLHVKIAKAQVASDKAIWHTEGAFYEDKEENTSTKPTVGPAL